MTPVRLEPAALRSRVKHSTTEPLRSHTLMRAIPEKNTWEGKTAGDIYISMVGWCEKFSNYMGHWCPTKSNYMGGWYYAAWKGKKEYHLPKKGKSFLKSSQKKA